MRLFSSRLFKCVCKLKRTSDACDVVVDRWSSAEVMCCGQVLRQCW